MTIGERIKKRRTELGMSQETLAERIGYKSKATINKIESGTNDLRQKKIKEIATVLGVTPSYLMGWDDQPTAEQPPKEQGEALTEQEKTLLDLFRKTTEQGRMRIIQAVLNICDEIEKKTGRTSEGFAG